MRIGTCDNTYKELKCDNLNVVKLANGGNFKTRTKLLNRKCHFKKNAKDYSIKVMHVAKERMLADCVTKAFSGPTLLNIVKNFICIE